MKFCTETRAGWFLAVCFSNLSSRCHNGVHPGFVGCHLRSWPAVFFLTGCGKKGASPGNRSPLPPTRSPRKTTRRPYPPAWKTRRRKLRRHVPDQDKRRFGRIEQEVRTWGGGFVLIRRRQPLKEWIALSHAAKCRRRRRERNMPLITRSTLFLIDR